MQTFVVNLYTNKNLNTLMVSIPLDPNKDYHGEQTIGYQSSTAWPPLLRNSQFVCSNMSTVITDLSAAHLIRHALPGNFSELYLHPSKTSILILRRRKED